ncbi:MAG: GNAT family N-acetyltransferase, partial [Candidatus Aminicenantes bacterium]
MELDARELPSRWNPRTLENWYWKFTARNPAGHSFIWVAEHEDHLVGHFAAVPFRLKVFDEELTASHTIGALVDKKFQNRGLLKFVGGKLMDELARNNIIYTWGFPNKLAHKFENVALGYNDLINFDEWKITTANLEKGPANPNIRQVTEFDRRFDQLWETCSSDYEIAVVRKAAFLNWRYLQRPDWEYFPFGFYDNEVLKGYIVLKLYREAEALRGHIIDIFGARNDEQTLSPLIDHSLYFFIEKNVTEVMVWFWGNRLIEELFTRKGFSKEEIDRPLILRINKEHKYQKEILDNSHWYFTMGDSTEIF